MDKFEHVHAEEAVHAAPQQEQHARAALQEGERGREEGRKKG